MTTTRTISYVGTAPQAWVVPLGVFAVTAQLTAGSGQDFGSGTGGNPAKIQGTLAVVPGDVLYLGCGQCGTYGAVGATGLHAAGAGSAYNGGGPGGESDNSNGGQGGGGLTDIRKNDPTLAGQVMVAGAGGAAGISGNGGQGGLLAGTAGSAGGTNAGHGGSQVAGGAPGGGAGVTGIAGTRGAGGQGANNGGGSGPPYGGGGGGGGYYGGGGGGADAGTGANQAGGGGGSSWVDTAQVSATSSTFVSKVVATDINGSITLTYDIAPEATPLYPVKYAKVIQASTYLFQWMYNDPDGDSHAASNFRYRIKDTINWNTTNNINVLGPAPGAMVQSAPTLSLTNGVTYEWQIQSKNSNGVTGAWSASSYFTPSALPAAKPGLLGGSQELALYDGNTGQFLDMISNRIAPTYLEELNNPGAGSFILQIKDARTLARRNMLRFRNVVRVKINNQWVGAWTIIKIEPKWVVIGEYSGMVMEISGLGIRGGVIPEAVVYPEDRNQVRDPGLLLATSNGKRVFGYGSSSLMGNWYQSLAWQPAYMEAQQNDTTPWNQGTATGNAWIGSPPSWPNPTAWWMSWENSKGADGDYNGGIYFHHEFAIGTDSYMVFDIAGDDAYVAYLDGVELKKGAPFNWTVAQSSSAVLVKAGVHVLSIELLQMFWTFAQPNNPSGLIVTGWLADATGNRIVVLLQSNPAVGTNQGITRFFVQGHPGNVPSWTIGDILTQLVSEALIRGVTSYKKWINLGFDPWIDTYGFRWPNDGTQWQFGVGSTYADVIDALEAINTDVWYDADQLTLKAAPNRGLNRALVYPNDTYAMMAARRYPYWFFPLDVAPNGSNQWTYGTNKLAFSGHSGATANTYATAMPTPCTLHGVTMSLTSGTISSGNLPASVSYYTDFWASVPVANTLIGQFTQSGLTEFFSIDIQDAKDSTGATITGLQQVYFGFADDTNITGGLTGQIANFPADPFSAYYVVQYYDNGATAHWEVWRNGNKIINFPVNPGHSLVNLSGNFQNYGRNFGDTPTASVQMAAWSWGRRNLSYDEIQQNYRAGVGAFNPVVSPVVFNAGINVIDAESSLEFQAKTAMIVSTSDETVEQRASDQIIQRLGRIESYFDGSQLSDVDALTVTSATIKNLLSTLTGNTLQILDDYTPWRDFDCGDMVMAPPDQVHRINYCKDSSFEVTGPSGVLDTTLWHTGATNAATMVPTALTGNALATALDGGSYAMRIGFPTCAAGASFVGLGGVGSPIIPGVTYTISAAFYTSSGTKMKIVNGSSSVSTTGTNGVWETVVMRFVGSNFEPTIGFENAAATVSGTDFALMDCILYEESPIQGQYFGDVVSGTIVDEVSGWAEIDEIYSVGESFYQPQPRRVMSISVSEDPDTRKPLYVIEVDSISQEDTQRLSRWVGRIAPQGSLNGVIPNALLST